jgi:CheY-like chemotaxis protein
VISKKANSQHVPHENILELFLVEDDKDDVFLFRTVLEEQKAAFRLKVSTDGEDALEELLNFRKDHYRPDLILIDLGIPRLNGLELLSKIKHDEDLKPLPVVVFSSSNDSTMVKEAYRLNVSGFIRKPKTIQEYKEIFQTLEKWWCSTIILPEKEAFSLKHPAYNPICFREAS